MAIYSEYHLSDPVPPGAQQQNPNPLLDALMANLGADTDAGLARRLKVALPIITMLREGRLSVSPSMLHRMHQASGIGLKELQALLQADCY